MEYIREDKFTRPRTPSDILNLALAKEKSSYDFYEKIIKVTKDEALIKLLTELKGAEWAHMERIKRLLERAK